MMLHGMKARSQKSVSSAPDQCMDCCAQQGVRLSAVYQLYDLIQNVPALALPDAGRVIRHGKSSHSPNHVYTLANVKL